MTRPLNAGNQPLRLAERLALARRQRFVGRMPELELFCRALKEAEAPFAVLHIYGPGGVGKTTLLREYARAAIEAGRPTVLLDGRDIEPSPASFLHALLPGLGLEEAGAPADALARHANSVILIDTYEAIAPLDRWLRETFLPQLPGRTMVIIAGRNPPAPAWRTDADWQGLTRMVPLRNLRPEESRAYLAARGVPQAQHEAVLAFTHGHPLALSLVGDVLSQRGAPVTFRPEESPDVVGALVKHFVQHVPDTNHRAALETCAHVRITTEAVLREALVQADAHDLFEWLRGLSFIEQGPFGLFPHDLAREAIDLDFRWRDPEAYRALHQRVRAHYVAELEATQGLERQRVFLDIMYLHRQNPIMKAYFDFKALGTGYAEPAGREDHEDILAMVEAHEGQQSAEIARYWLARQPEAFWIMRGTKREPIGFGAQVKLHLATAEDLAADPAARAAWEYARRHAPPRPGEAMYLARFLIDRAVYQQPSPAINLFQIISTIQWLTTPNLAWSFVLAFADPAFWRPIMSYIDYRRAPEADFTVGGRRYGGYVHDYRVVDAAAWLDLTGSRELATDLTPEALEAQRQTPQLLVLSQPEFVDAVRSALRDYHRTPALAANPLMRSRLIAERSDAAPGPAALQALMREAAETLRATPRTLKLYRAVWHTYFEPAATQELAAELLGLPFSTYRYHLAKGIERMTDWLWQRELHGCEA